MELKVGMKVYFKNLADMNELQNAILTEGMVTDINKSRSHIIRKVDKAGFFKIENSTYIYDIELLDIKKTKYKILKRLFKMGRLTHFWVNNKCRDTELNAYEYKGKKLELVKLKSTYATDDKWLFFKEYLCIGIEYVNFKKTLKEIF